MLYFYGCRNLKGDPFSQEILRISFEHTSPETCLSNWLFKTNGFRVIFIQK